MRSLTLSSADTSCFSHPRHDLPAFSSPTPPHLPETRPPNHETVTLLRTHSTPHTPNRSSFFDIVDDTQLLSPLSMNHVNQAIQSGWADSTIRHYSGAIKHFKRFCDSEGILENLRFPADEFVLCAFGASSIGKHTRSTPSNHLSALKAWHIAHNME